jgi:hypothetical protein
MKAEEKEVAALLVLDTDYESDAAMDINYESGESEYAPDSEGDLLLTPPAGVRSPYGYR